MSRPEQGPGSAIAPAPTTPLGATHLGDGRTSFCVWAPKAERVAVHILGSHDRLVPLARAGRGYFCATVPDAPPGTLYCYRLDDDRELPDPASRFQPEGVHGPSAVVDRASFTWTDAGWFGVAQRDLVFYELHVGTFTPEGTFDAVIPRLDSLRDLGVTAIELLPVAQFPGARNWGYDGVYPYAVQASYGGPDGLRRLVDACHARGLALFLDVVYNHLGPEGNYLGEYGHYFTERYRTPWGQALNFDGPHSDEVRRYYFEQAIYLLSAFHLDGFRLDAIHAIADQSAVPFLREYAAIVHREADRLGRRVYVVAESDLNDARVILPTVLHGWDHDAQWSDDLHHALHTLLTGEHTGYYADFGRLDQLARAYRQSYVYAGDYALHRQRRHGNSPALARAEQFVVFAQNHDQVGNRAQGERLTALVSFDALKLAAGVVLLSPFLPLLFMGEEYGEPRPFLYVTSHSDPELVEAVRRGRRAEFAAFGWASEVPDPQDAATFQRSVLQWQLAEGGQHQALRAYYRELLRLRREVPALAELDKDHVETRVLEAERVLFVRRGHPLHERAPSRPPPGAGDHSRAASHATEVCLAFAFADQPGLVELPVPAGRWRKLLDAADTRWLGPGSDVSDTLDSTGAVRLNLPPHAVVLFAPEAEE
jgi:maltooligosyltrehalose trehalohydrolase